MTDLAVRDRYQRLVERIRPAATLARYWPLEGGVSAHITAVELALPGGDTERIVVRRHGAIDKGHNPKIATDEFRVLQIVCDAGLAAPAPLLLDQDCEILDSPGLVTEYIHGSTEMAPEAVPDALRRMASYLTRLHALNLGPLDLSFLPRRDDPIVGILRHLPDTPDAACVRDALAAHAPYAPANPPVLLHGDYWPGNIMWRDGQIAAVLDWEDAAVGDPLADLASGRLELVWKFGQGAADQLTAHYTSMAELDLANLPLWELCAASGAAAHMSEWGLNPEAEADMRQQANDFVDRALFRLTAT